MTTLDHAIAHATEELRSGRRITEALLLARFPALSAFGAASALRAAEDATEPPMPTPGTKRSGGTTFCTSDRAIEGRKMVEAMDRAAAAIPRTTMQAGRKR